MSTQRIGQRRAPGGQGTTGMKGRQMLAMVALAVAAAACGGGDDVASGDVEQPAGPSGEEQRAPEPEEVSGGGGDAGGGTCTLITSAEVEGLLGEGVAQYSASGTGEGEDEGCYFTMASGPDLYVGSFSFEGATTLYDAALDLAGDDAVTITGFGDRSFLTETEFPPQVSVFVVEGGTYLELEVPDIGSADAGSAEALARAAFGRI